MTIITKTHILAINRARTTVTAIQEALHDSSYEDGRLDEACEQAGRSLFNILAIAHSYGLSEQTMEELLADVAKP